ncbi:MAG: Nif3-like dinuclear metal center hexameric protein [Bacteroidales bacterium]
MVKIKEIIQIFEKLAPLSLQEQYDNSGLLVGNSDKVCTGALLTIDTTEEIVDEAESKGLNLIISHHPVIFSGVKSFTGKNYVERTIIKAIEKGIAILAVHTNLDSVYEGVNYKICEKFNLTSPKILSPTKGILKKLVTFVPAEHIEKVRNAVFDAGAGHIGNYESCSYNLSGKGSFKASDTSNPFVGQKGKIHFEDEIRFETIFPQYIQHAVIDALIKNHPYEEVAFDIYPLDNEFSKAGMGMVGNLAEDMDEIEFLDLLKKLFKIPFIKHTKLPGKKIKRVAVCGGSGSFLLKEAIKSGADIFVSGDFKYHQFFDAENKILVADIGHFESEQYTKEIFYDILTKKFPNFAVHFSEVNTNPVYYF